MVLLQRVQDLSHAPVDFLNDITVQAPETRVVEVLGSEERDMGQVVCKIDEEGLVRVFMHELAGLFRVPFRNRMLVGRPLDDVLISHQRDIPVFDLRIEKGGHPFG